MDISGANPITLILLGVGAAAAILLLIKIYGLIFMTGNSPHRVGDAMNVHRASVTEWSGSEGMVNAGGELWRAMSKDDLAPGDHVEVASMKGLVLHVRKKRN
ncbi:MAG: hypothetical protein HKP25_00455 [Marinicaulis sp.]|nr:hypothetical protein [Marinicaulis sp.]